MQLRKKNERDSSGMPVNPLRTADSKAGVFRWAAAALATTELQVPR